AYPSEQPAGYGAQGAVAGIKVHAGQDPAGARAAYARGKAALTAPEARVHFEESTRLDPARPEAYNALALNALYRGDLNDADQWFKKSLQADPTYYPARYNYERFRRQHAR
ncbi:MAG: tetratricopeptide repeat protein, partial [Planctomycetota bacterium]|nr:tetratricopeptide repeat protein [Planctomycetota bacterium]